MLKKALMFFAFFIPMMAAAQDEIRTAAGDTVLRKVLAIERQEFFKPTPQLYLENAGQGVLPTKVPFSYVKSIRFQDGCEVFFDENGLVFDKTLNPRKVTVNQGTSLFLEDVYKMNKQESQLLFGKEVYEKELRPYQKLYERGELVFFGGVALCLPFAGTHLLNLARMGDKDRTPYAYGPSNRFVNSLAVVGVLCIATGATFCVIGHKRCKRLAVSFTGTGVNLSGTF